MKSMVCAIILLAAQALHADAPLAMIQMVKGSNVYAPCVIYDQQENKYKMWYGGWQVGSDKPNDNIYYRESTNGTNWGAYTKVIDHATLGLYHVNDPSVIKAWNGALNKWMYWIYFTGIDCNPDDTNACSISRHHIYAGSGFDGKTFGAYQVVVNDYEGTNGVFSPSVVSINDTNGEFWLYYQITGIADRIVLSKLSGGTMITTNVVVYTSAMDGAHNPDVARLPDGTWSMLYNRIDTNNAFHIWSLTSTNGVDWTNDTLILYSGCSPFCVATTPNHRWVTPTNYWMYYGLDKTLSNPSGEIHGWYMKR
jgi:hypothetical protein